MTAMRTEPTDFIELVDRLAGGVQRMKEGTDEVFEIRLRGIVRSIIQELGIFERFQLMQEAIDGMAVRMAGRMP